MGEIMDNVILLIFGILFIIIGTMNMKGDISSIHWYHRTRIKEKDKKQYGKLVGFSTIIIGAFMIFDFLLKVIFSFENDLILIIGFVLGLVLFIYAQIKYNKGIF